MGIGVSVFLIAVGAILTWAVEFATEGIDLNVVGVILMLVGFLGLVFSLLFWSSMAPFGHNRDVYTETHTDTGHTHRHVA